MEAHARPQMEDPDRRLGVLPALGKTRSRIEIRVELHETVEQQVRDAIRGGVARQPRVQRLCVHIRTEADHDEVGAPLVRTGGCERECHGNRPWAWLARSLDRIVRHGSERSGGHDGTATHGAISSSSGRKTCGPT